MKHLKKSAILVLCGCLLVLAVVVVLLIPRKQPEPYELKPYLGKFVMTAYLLDADAYFVADGYDGEFDLQYFKIPKKGMSAWRTDVLGYEAYCVYCRTWGLPQNTPTRSCTIFCTLKPVETITALRCALAA